MLRKSRKPSVVLPDQCSPRWSITAPPDAPLMVDRVAVPPQLVAEPPASASMVTGTKPTIAAGLVVADPAGDGPAVPGSSADVVTPGDAPATGATPVAFPFADGPGDDVPEMSS